MKSRDLRETTSKAGLILKTYHVLLFFRRVGSSGGSRDHRELGHLPIGGQSYSWCPGSTDSSHQEAEWMNNWIQGSLQIATWVPGEW